jgi:hypothetical protein
MTALSRVADQAEVKSLNPMKMVLFALTAHIKATVMIAIAITLKFLEVVLWKTQALVIVSGHRQRQG